MFGEQVQIYSIESYQEAMEDTGLLNSQCPSSFKEV